MARRKKYFITANDEEGKITFTVLANTETEARKQIEDNEDVEIEDIISARGKHLCKYCGDIVFSPEEDLLCEECRDMFGHSLYSEL